MTSFFDQAAHLLPKRHQVGITHVAVTAGQSARFMPGADELVAYGALKSFCQLLNGCIHGCDGGAAVGGDMKARAAACGLNCAVSQQIKLSRSFQCSPLPTQERIGYFIRDFQTPSSIINAAAAASMQHAACSMQKEEEGRGRRRRRRRRQRRHRRSHQLVLLGIHTLRSDT